MNNYRDAIWLNQKYWHENLSVGQIADLSGHDRATIRYQMKINNIPIRNKKTGIIARHKFYPFLPSKTSFQSKERNLNWKGGIRLDSDGYICILKKDHPDSDSWGYCKEHRLIAEKVLGRRLKSNEHIHHINGDKTDNRNSNLMICKNWYHLWLHKKLKRLNKLGIEVMP